MKYDNKAILRGKIDINIIFNFLLSIYIELSSHIHSHTNIKGQKGQKGQKTYLSRIIAFFGIWDKKDKM